MVVQGEIHYSDVRTGIEPTLVEKSLQTMQKILFKIKFLA